MRKHYNNLASTNFHQQTFAFYPAVYYNSLMKLKKLVPQNIKNIYHNLNSKYYSQYFGNPSSKLKVIGVTGTDGKTTTSTMLHHILNFADKKAGLISTISAKIGNNEYPLGFHVTTPDPKLVQKFLCDMVQADLEIAVLETTSHGLDQHRVGGIEYYGAVYTNITHEHLDYHKTFENYRQAKMHLIDQTSPKGFSVINLNDESADILISHSAQRQREIVVYAIADKNKPATQTQLHTNIIASSINATSETTSFTVKFTDINSGKSETESFTIKLPGIYNVSNALAATSAALMLGATLKQCSQALTTLENLNGRWEMLQEKPYKIVVDFAHTPNALENVLEIAKKKLNKSEGRIILVFGCAGLRDTSKRPLMGAIAGANANVTILTAEDPRTEKVADINHQIIKGLLDKSPMKKLNEDYYSIEDRTEAISKAISLAKPGDIVLITGKGHERSMNLDGKNEIHWSDQEVVQKIINIKK